VSTLLVFPYKAGCRVRCTCPFSYVLCQLCIVSFWGQSGLRRCSCWYSM